MKSDRRPRVALRRRLLVFLLAPLSVLLAISVVYDYETAADPADVAFDRVLLDDAATMATRIHIDDAGRPSLRLSPAEDSLLRQDGSDIEFLSAWDSSGKLLYGDADLLPTPVDPDTGFTFSSEVLRGHRIRKLTYLVETRGGTVALAVGETTRRREQAASHIVAAMIVPNFLFIAATLLVVYLGVRRGLRPLNQLGEEIARRSPHDLSPLQASRVPVEAEPLITAMNGLMRDVNAATAAQHAFLANAAHQLRTPLAGLQTQLDLAAEEVPPECRERILRMRDATQRLGHLTHQLLALARSGPDAVLAQEFRSVELISLIENSVSQWYDASLGRQIDLGFETHPARVYGSPWMLNELLGNLIDNALRYTPPGGQVTVRCGEDGHGRPFVEVEDNGPGIPAAEQQRVFERFYRLADGKESGSGLGLSIVREVAERHGATIEIASTPQGTRIRAVFPPEPPAKFGELGADAGKSTA